MKIGARNEWILAGQGDPGPAYVMADPDFGLYELRGASHSRAVRRYPSARRLRLVEDEEPGVVGVPGDGQGCQSRPRQAVP